MAKQKKVTKEELTSIKTINDKVNGETFNLGVLEVQKVEHIGALQAARQELSILQNDLEEKYGKVTIDLKDGKISEIKPNESA
jgi:hypothetical protein